jgi:hypothetical protein
MARGKGRSRKRRQSLNVRPVRKGKEKRPNPFDQDALRTGLEVLAFGCFGSGLLRALGISPLEALLEALATLQKAGKAKQSDVTELERLHNLESD